VAFGFAGHWSGTWVNHTAQSNGTLEVDVSVNSDCTAQATFEGIFGTSGPQTVNLAFHDQNGGAVIEISGDPLFGDATITVAANGDVTISGQDAHQDIESYTGTGIAVPGNIELELELQFGAGGSAMETIELNQDSTPTPSPSPTPSSTPSPEPTPEGQQVAWGNNNCSGNGLDAPDPVDGLFVLRFDGGLSTDTGDCPDMGDPVVFSVASVLMWGDADCDLSVNPVDSLKILRFDGGLNVTQEQGCPKIGDIVTLPGGNGGALFALTSDAFD
jgi:hypothetical protein